MNLSELPLICIKKIFSFLNTFEILNFLQVIESTDKNCGSFKYLFDKKYLNLFDHLFKFI